MSKYKRLILFLSIIFLTGFLWNNFLQQKNIVPIIMYHQVVPNPCPLNKLAISVKTFESQMEFLKRNHYHVLPLENVVDLMKNQKKIPSRTIALTFDDGKENNYTHIFPILKKYNFPATLSLIVGNINLPGYLSTGQIKAMLASGLISIASHTLSHSDLTEISDLQRLNAEISNSRLILANQFGYPVKIFCYPEGNFNSLTRKMVIDSGYVAALAIGTDGYKNDIFALKRIGIAGKWGSLLFTFWLNEPQVYNLYYNLKKKIKTLYLIAIKYFIANA